MALCIWAGTTLLATLPLAEFTLAWTHSIEKIRWEEDWRVTAEGIQIVEARIRGTGAGMEPPSGAQLRNGVWHYRPTPTVHEEVRLARSGELPDYEICTAGECSTLSALVPGANAASSVVLIGCDQGGLEN